MLFREIGVYWMRALCNDPPILNLNRGLKKRRIHSRWQWLLVDQGTLNCCRLARKNFGRQIKPLNTASPCISKVCYCISIPCSLINDLMHTADSLINWHLCTWMINLVTTIINGSLDRLILRYCERSSLDQAGFNNVVITCILSITTVYTKADYKPPV